MQMSKKEKRSIFLNQLKKEHAAFYVAFLKMI